MLRKRYKTNIKWKLVCNGYYEVSNTGIVRSVRYNRELVPQDNYTIGQQKLTWKEVTKIRKLCKQNPLDHLDQIKQSYLKGTLVKCLV